MVQPFMQRHESIFLFLSAPKSSELIAEVQDYRVIFPNRHIEHGETSTKTSAGIVAKVSEFDENFPSTLRPVARDLGVKLAFITG